MQRQRSKSHWWATPLGWILGIGMAFASIPIAMYVQDYLNPWAAPLVWVALALAALASIGYFASKLAGWLAAGIIGLTIGFSFGLALVEGWDTQVQVGLAIARIGLFVGSIVFVIGFTIWRLRLNRLFAGAFREVGEGIRTDALFHDDGDRLVVCPNRLRLLRLILPQLGFVAAGALGFHWMWSSSSNPFALGCAGFLFLFMGLLTALNIVRLVMRGPALVIGPDGLLDNASQIVTGRGLLRWDELIDVLDYTYKSGKISPTYHMLGIVLTDAATVRSRQPAVKRALGFLGQGQMPGMIVVTRALLDRPPDALAEEIKRYARSHAPRGWTSPLIMEEDEDEREQADLTP